MTIDRRAALTLCAALLAAPRTALALDEAAARAFIEDLAAELTALVRSASPGDPRVDAFRALLRETAALDAVGRFTMGLAWRDMSADQQARFLDAFERYAARVYADQLGEYRGQTIEVTGAQDAGRKGVLVRSLIKSPEAQDIRVEWLVNDREGPVRLVDIIAEGVSLSISQREEFAAMLDRRGGDIDAFIADLDAR